MLEFKGKGIDEVAIISEITNKDVKVKVGDVVMKIDPAYFRPTEVELLIGDPSKAKRELKWELTYDLDSLD